MKPMGKKGYTVIELMIAIVIFSLGIMAVYSLQVLTVASLGEARELTEATNLAERIMEQFRRNSTTWEEGSQPPGIPQQGVGQWVVLYPQQLNKDGLFANQIPDTSPGLPPRYCVKYRMSELGTPGSGTYRVEVRVIWPRRTGLERQFASCPADMDSTQNIPYARQVTLAGAIYRH